MTTALLIVDVQRDFVEGGALGVKGGLRVASDVASLVRSAGRGYASVIATKDWHKPLPDTNCGHFAVGTEPDYVKSWPVHCVADTDGAKFAPVLGPVIDEIDAVFRKGHGTQSYSALEGVHPAHGSLLSYLRSREIETVEVCGIATDYCVRASVLDLLGTGFQVKLLGGFIAGVAQESSRAAVDEMMSAGAALVL